MRRDGSCGLRGEELMATCFAPRSPTTRLSGYQDNPYIFLDDMSIHSCLHAGKTVHHSDRLWICRKTDPDDPQLSTRFRSASLPTMPMRDRLLLLVPNRNRARIPTGVQRTLEHSEWFSLPWPPRLQLMRNTHRKWV